jgi:hypothetical protein
VRHSQSHLSSLATLLQNAEARRSATPAPAVAVADDSGLIDIAAMQARAREERARTTVATRTPVPMVRTVPGVETDPDLLASAMRSERRKKKIFLGMILGAVGLLAIGVGSARRKAHPPLADTHVVAAAPPALPPAAPAPPPPAPAPAPPPAPVVAAAPPAPEPAATTPAKSKSKKHKHAKSKGSKLQKVTSSGVP